MQQATSTQPTGQPGPCRPPAAVTDLCPGRPGWLNHCGPARPLGYRRRQGRSLLNVIHQRGWLPSPTAGAWLLPRQHGEDGLEHGPKCVQLRYGSSAVVQKEGETERIGQSPLKYNCHYQTGLDWPMFICDGHRNGGCRYRQYVTIHAHRADSSISQRNYDTRSTELLNLAVRAASPASRPRLI